MTVYTQTYCVLPCSECFFVFITFDQEVALKSQPGWQSIPPPQYYSQLITEIESLGWDKYDMLTPYYFGPCLHLGVSFILYIDKILTQGCRTQVLSGPRWYFCEPLQGRKLRSLCVHLFSKLFFTVAVKKEISQAYCR